jgi:head-tail adaptor
MQGGKLRWPIEIEHKVGTQDPVTGQMTYVWSLFVATRADKQTAVKRGSKAIWEQVYAQQEHAIRVVLWDIRYIAGIDETMRIKDVSTSEYYNIRAIVDVDGRRRELWLMAEFGLNKG